MEKLKSFNKQNTVVQCHIELSSNINSLHLRLITNFNKIFSCEIMLQVLKSDATITNASENNYYMFCHFVLMRNRVLKERKFS